MREAALAVVPVILGICAWGNSAAARDNDDANAAMIAARQKFFGAENVDPWRGDVRRDRVIVSWVTNASLAASIEGRIVLLDTYVNRLEVAPPPDGSDLRRTPINVQDLVDLRPEAIFLGHGHGDHADNAAYIAKWLNIPIYSTPETCDVMQVDVQRMAADPNTANGGVKIIPNGNPVNCIPLVTPGVGAGHRSCDRQPTQAGRGHHRLQAYPFRHGPDGSGLSIRSCHQQLRFAGSANLPSPGSVSPLRLPTGYNAARAIRPW